MSLVTLAKYKEYLKIGSSDTTRDAELTDMASAVEKRIKTFLNRDLETASYVEIYNGTDCGELPLRQTPITAITKVEEYEGLDSTNTEVWVTYALGTDYERLFIPTTAHAIMMYGRDFSYGMQNYRITYTAGYSTIPADIQLACKELLKVTWDNSPVNQGRLGFLSTSANGGSATENLSLDSEIEMKILKKIEHHRAFNV